MAIIGLNSAAGLGSIAETTASLHSILNGTGFTYTAGTSEEVFRFGFIPGNGTTYASLQIGLYDITTGTWSLVASATVTAVAANTAVTADISGVALTDGNTYASAWRVISNGTMSRAFTAAAARQSTLDGTSALASTFTNNSSLTQKYAVWAETQAASTPAAEITSVTGPASAANTIRQGESSTIAGTGFEASQSTGNTDLDGTSLTETAWSDTSITITGPSSGEMFGAGKTLTVTPATNTADSIAGQTYLPPTGQSYITFDAGGISGMSAASIGYGITGLAADDQARFETTATKVGAPGTTCTVTVAEGSGNIELTGVTAAGDYEFSAWFRDASDATDSGESVITFDATVPEIASVTIDATGLILTVTLTENAAIGAGGSGGVTLVGQYGAITATYDSLSTTDLLFDLSRTAYDDEVLTLNYAQPGAGITDTVGNELATITGQAITNNSTEVYDYGGTANHGGRMRSRYRTR